jgi:DNA polymerase-3 subunit delta'
LALKNVVGQDRALEILRGGIAKNRIAHAYLFRGEEGIGKKLTALNFAKILNCLNNGNPLHISFDSTDTKPPYEHSDIHDVIDCCDTCSSCIKINKHTHPDVYLLSPDGGQIKVDAIRELEESLSFKAFEGNWKVVIIDNADTLNQSAANAFLKTLEEPPGKSVIILVSSLPELIPLTIRSRCHSVHFSTLSLVKMEKLLESDFSQDSTGLNSSQTLLVSLLSGGRPGWARNRDLIPARDEAFQDFETLLNGVEEDIWPDRNAIEKWFDWVQLWLRDIAVFKASGRKDLLINRDKEKKIRELSQKTDLREVLQLSSTFYNIRAAIRFNLNKQITLYHTHLLLRKTFSCNSLSARQFSRG